jgi:cyanate permease
MLAGLENGGNAVYAGTLIKERYGQKNYGINLGITNVHIIIASFLGNGLAGQIRTASGNYQGALTMMLGFGLTSLLLFFITIRVEKAENSRKEMKKAEQSH